MKNLFLGLVVIIMAATSCATVRNTQTSVTTSDVTAPVIAATIADLEVSPQKISYTYQSGQAAAVTTNTTEKKAKKNKQITLYNSVDNIVRLAISEALKTHGDADVLVEAQTTIVYKAKGLNRSIESVTVTGYPAKYKNFRNADNETLNKAIENGTLLPGAGSPSVFVNTKTENSTFIRK